METMKREYTRRVMAGKKTDRPHVAHYIAAQTGNMLHGCMPRSLAPWDSVLAFAGPRSSLCQRSGVSETGFQLADRWGIGEGGLKSVALRTDNVPTYGCGNTSPAAEASTHEWLVKRTRSSLPTMYTRSTVSELLALILGIFGGLEIASIGFADTTS